MMEEKYRVKNKFLRAIMGNYTRSKLDLNVDYNLSGLTHGKGDGSTILTYIVKKTFNIHRLPFYEDRHFTNSSNDAIYSYKDKSTLNHILKSEQFLNNLDAMTEELYQIHLFTQKKLDDLYPGQDFVRLYRNVNAGYADILLQLKKNAIESSLECVAIETDTVDCFTDNSSTYSSDVQYAVDIKKEDILYCYQSLEIDSEALLEKYEFVIMNRDIRGLRTIPTNGIIKTKSDFKELSYITYPIMSRTQHCHIRSSANDNVCYDEPKLKPSFEKRPSLLCELIKRFCNNR